MNIYFFLLYSSSFSKLYQLLFFNYFLFFICFFCIVLLFHFCFSSTVNFLIAFFNSVICSFHYFSSVIVVVLLLISWQWGFDVLNLMKIRFSVLYDILIMRLMIFSINFILWLWFSTYIFCFSSTAICIFYFISVFFFFIC